jgi:hypothetical protein
VHGPALEIARALFVFCYTPPMKKDGDGRSPIDPDDVSPNESDRLQERMDQAIDYLHRLGESILFIDDFSGEEALAHALSQVRGEAIFSSAAAELAKLEGKTDEYTVCQERVTTLLTIIDKADSGNYDPLKDFIQNAASEHLDTAEQFRSEAPKEAEGLRELGDKYLLIAKAIPPLMPN